MPSDVVILFGGTSSERFVSVASAQNVSTLLPEAGLWFWGVDDAVTLADAPTLAAHQQVFQRPFEPRRAPRFASLEAALDSPEARGAVFLLALHGGDGENGSLQARLEARRIPFTGSGAAASARAFDKDVTRRLLEAAGARVARAHLIEADAASTLEHRLTALFDEAPRWVLKPVADGSSVGLVHLTSPAMTTGAARQLADSKRRYLAETFIEGRELTVGVVDEPTGAVALPVSEVRTRPGGAFDYAGKYLGAGTEELTPAPISDEAREQAQRLALLAHRTVGCLGYSRTDLILTPSGPVFLEINTLPGLTKASFIPQQLAAAGKDLHAFLVRQLDLARARYG